jgi:hypothetical protein
MQMQQRPQQPCSRPVHIVLEETDFRCLVAGGQIEVDQWVGLRRVDLPIADELQPAANLAAACSVRRFTTRWIPLREASAFVAKHHRHNAPPKGAIVAVGLFEIGLSRGGTWSTPTRERPEPNYPLARKIRWWTPLRSQGEIEL